MSCRDDKENKEHKVIDVKSASLSWGSDFDKPYFKDLNFSIDEGSLVAIIGSVGSGKSSLLSGILGEMKLFKGSINVDKSKKIAYVPQQAWIQNMSIRDNILFGKSMDEKLYLNTLESSALVDDLKILPSGDATEIGENGVNLSGGQKQRVSIARALYENPDIYFFDDPLSALDVHVGEHLFYNVLGPNGALKDKTRILVTHAIKFLPYVDKIILMDDGDILCHGTYDELMENKVFQKFEHSLPANQETDSESESDELVINEEDLQDTKQTPNMEI